jgi:hypothetical protein
MPEREVVKAALQKARILVLLRDLDAHAQGQGPLIRFLLAQPRRRAKLEAIAEHLYRDKPIKNPIRSARRLCERTRKKFLTAKYRGKDYPFHLTIRNNTVTLVDLE